MEDSCMRVDAEGIHLPTSLLPEAMTIDVRWQGRRVWSVHARDLDQSIERVVLRWPVPLQPLLRGRGVVSLAVHGRSQPFVSVEAALSDSGLLEARDEGGHWVAVNKWGRLARTFEDAPPPPELVEMTELVLSVLRDVCGFDPYLTYGSLLGAVREGSYIAHDDDMDVGYLSAHESPADVALESFAVERALAANGFDVRRLSVGHLQLTAPPGPDDDPPQSAAVHLDVFTSFITAGFLYQAFAVRARLTRSDVLPTCRVLLDGRSFPAPRRPESWLAATYGPSWRRPDPAFTFDVDPAAAERLYGWLGDLNMHREYWESFYTGRDASKVPQVPSLFAAWTLPRLRPGARLVEIGSGNGRDALWFATRGRAVLGLDYAAPAVEYCRSSAAARGLSADFQVCNLYDRRTVLSLVQDLSASGPDVYARFLVHALEDEGRANLWLLLFGVLRGDGRAFLEFRTDGDADRRHVFDHFRRYLRLQDVVEEVEDAGLEVVEVVEGSGMAPYGDEDPVVARIVLARP